MHTFIINATLFNTVSLQRVLAFMFYLTCRILHLVTHVVDLSVELYLSYWLKMAL